MHNILLIRRCQHTHEEIVASKFCNNKYSINPLRRFHVGWLLFGQMQPIDLCFTSKVGSCLSKPRKPRKPTTATADCNIEMEILPDTSLILYRCRTGCCQNVIEKRARLSFNVSLKEVASDALLFFQVSNGGVRIPRPGLKTYRVL